jgi:hypothetical protein
VSAGTLILSRPIEKDERQLPRSSGSRSARSVCTTARRERQALASASVCRMHIVDILRAEGELIPWEEGDFAGATAAAIHMLRVAFEGSWRRSRSRAKTEGLGRAHEGRSDPPRRRATHFVMRGREAEACLVD